MANPRLLPEDLFQQTRYCNVLTRCMAGHQNEKEKPCHCEGSIFYFPVDAKEKVLFVTRRRKAMTSVAIKYPVPLVPLWACRFAAGTRQTAVPVFYNGNEDSRSFRATPAFNSKS